jgi:hypothetical protein
MNRCVPARKTRYGALVHDRLFQPGETFRPRLPCRPPLPRPDPTVAQGKADTRTLLEESP